LSDSSEPDISALPAETAHVEVERPERVELDNVTEVALAAMLAPTWQVAFLSRNTKAAIAEARGWPAFSAA